MTQDSIVRTYILARATFYTFANIVCFDLSVNNLVHFRRANICAFASTAAKVQINLNPLICLFPSFHIGHFSLPLICFDSQGIVVTNGLLSLWQMICVTWRPDVAANGRLAFPTHCPTI